MKRGLSFTRRAGLRGAISSLAFGAAHAQPGQPAPVENVSMIMPGNVTYRAKLYLPRKTPAPAVIVVHDGWGATPDFEALGANLAFEGMFGLVIDLADGRMAETPAGAEQLAAQIDGDQPGEVISAWYDWLRNRLDSDRRVGAMGFGPGGRWAVKGSTHKGANGVAVWSVRLDTSVNDLHSIYEAFVGHFSDRDVVPGQVYVAELSQRLRAAKREGHLFRYGARPGFYNPRSPEYDKPDANLAWRRTLTIYKKMWALTSAQ
jgi:carboxymethylenebutenolidase